MDPKSLLITPRSIKQIPRESNLFVFILFSMQRWYQALKDGGLPFLLIQGVNFIFHFSNRGRGWNRNVASPWFWMPNDRGGGGGELCFLRDVYDP